MSDKKIALITGANKGIGFETAKQLAQKGITVLIGARDVSEGNEAADSLKAENFDAHFVELDIVDEKTRESAREFIEKQFGKLDILINNAAVDLEGSAEGTAKTASETTLKTYRETFETNLFGLIAVTQTFLPLIRKSDAGRIVNVSSIRGSLTHQSDPNDDLYDKKVPAYDVTKTAINAFTVSLAVELKDTKIKVNIAHPGWVKTEMGGGDADLTIEDGAKTSVDLATLDENGYTGKFIYLGEELPW
ncbi:MAG: SDR family oxidoreductase [Pyrinomonadaceae bacterium]|nr:SDR family oxidoreductase [Pyrinomonadaceae bacterium]